MCSESVWTIRQDAVLWFRFNISPQSLMHSDDGFGKIIVWGASHSSADSLIDEFMAECAVRRKLLMRREESLVARTREVCCHPWPPVLSSPPHSSPAFLHAHLSLSSSFSYLFLIFLFLLLLHFPLLLFPLLLLFLFFTFLLFSSTFPPPSPTDMGLTDSLYHALLPYCFCFRASQQ